MGVTPEPGETPFFALEVLRSFDVRLSQDAMGQGVFSTGNENQFGDPLGDCAISYALRF